MDNDTGLKRLALVAAWHAVNVLLYILIMIGGIGAGYLAWKEFGQIGLFTVIILAAWLRLRHDIAAIRRGDLDPDKSPQGPDGRNDGRQGRSDHPFHKAGRE